jgi:pilus assembly protein Flp/PilA
MTTLIAQMRAYIKDESGATAIEYGLIAGGIALAIVAALFAFGDDLARVFSAMGGAMDAAADNIEDATGEIE